MTCELNETFSRADLERIVFYMLSTRLLFYIAQSVISDDRLRRSLRLADPHDNERYPLNVPMWHCDIANVKKIDYGTLTPSLLSLNLVRKL